MRIAVLLALVSLLGTPPAALANAARSHRAQRVVAKKVKAPQTRAGNVQHKNTLAKRTTGGSAKLAIARSAPKTAISTKASPRRWRRTRAAFGAVFNKTNLFLGLSFMGGLYTSISIDGPAGSSTEVKVPAPESPNQPTIMAETSTAETSTREEAN